jgi:hypothetical protein
LKQFERTLIKRDLFLATIQIIAMVLAIFGAGSYLSYQNSKLIEQIDKRIGDSNRQMDKRFEQMDKRFEQMEKRFEDLKQVVLSDRRQQGKNNTSVFNWVKPLPDRGPSESLNSKRHEPESERAARK